jgi:hypothetical protein
VKTRHDRTYGHSLHLAYFLDLVSGTSDLETLKDRLGLSLREEPLLRRLGRRFSFIRAAKNNLVVLVILIEESLLVVDRTRGYFHLHRVLLGILLDLLQVFVVAILSKPSNNVAARPVDLEGVFMLIVYVILDDGQVNNWFGRKLLICCLHRWASDQRALSFRYRTLEHRHRTRRLRRQPPWLGGQRDRSVE